MGSGAAAAGAASDPGATTSQPPAAPWRGVFFTGPEAERDPRGERDEFPVWHVFVGDQEANPVSKVYRILSFAKADNLARVIAKDRSLELVADATAA